MITTARCPKENGRAAIAQLLVGIFLTGLLLTVLLVYSAFVSYRVGAVRDMAVADAQRISHLVFEHLYSVMRKGVNRDELDDLVHHIQGHLPSYRVDVIRGEPVVRQFGDRPGQDALRRQDALVAEALSSGQTRVETQGDNLRYVFPVLVTPECAGCHALAQVGEVNGVIAVSVPLRALEAPIAHMAYPIMALTFGLVVALLLVTFLILRQRVTQPITDLTEHVVQIGENGNFAQDLTVDRRWPRELESLARQFNVLMAQVRESHQALKEVSLRDPLTRLYNRRHFDASLVQAALDAQQGSSAFAVLMIDLDRFKPINDVYGHAAGDAVLVGVARALQETVRDTDLAARIGGDEFAVIALASDVGCAEELAERLRRAVEWCSFRFGRDTVQVGCSIGMACHPADGIQAMDLVRVADEAMYADKARRKAQR